MLPNFIGIGTQRAGTTWIHRCLAEHPQVFVPEPKEVQFFNRHFDQGLTWYEARFQASPRQRAVGEISPNYLSSEVAIPRMAQAIPQARLFVVLREPVQRAYSAYRLLHAHQKGLTFREACKTGRNLVTVGLYSKQLRRVYEHYPRDQVKVFLYDDLQHTPGQFLAELFLFLDVDATFQPTTLHVRYNRIMYPQVQGALQRARLTWAMRVLKRSHFGHWLRRFHTAAGPSLSTELDEHDIRELKKLFRDDVLALQDLLGRDLTAWL